MTGGAAQQELRMVDAEALVGHTPELGEPRKTGFDRCTRARERADNVGVVGTFGRDARPV